MKIQFNTSHSLPSVHIAELLMPNTNLFFQWVIMNSASEVGEIFTRAGDAYNKLGDMIMTLHPAGQELQALESNIDRRVRFICEFREKHFSLIT